MGDVAYIGNVAKLAVELVNQDEPSELRAAFFEQHRIAEPDAGTLAELLPLLRDAVATTADGGPVEPVNRLLEKYPPLMYVSTHGGETHLHFAPDGEEPASWLGRSCAAALAHVICGDPHVTVGRCQADGCERFYVDDSRNHSRRFCSNTCASRTTVAAYRARRKAARA
ncbi:CGNR zinc finger domain-containing protein [Actinomadura rupiterrae]|uniref:CGNR zinc finger domain-containing protein n=1 Tax=Actinomadura rupiterrae TaxID=559627 RepID=UPI0020A372D2|nr:CGNR zinc finger domain-containing protein [Actinomadura rupiterrae]MCP2338940.1 putative RNA-binding Zn ribbon-like protein [Actinomadura rupiterrae]